MLIPQAEERSAIDAHPDPTTKLGDLAAASGLHRIHMFAWRDLDDVEAGGSELHAAMIAKLWAQAGIEVTMRTSYAQGHPPTRVRDGYKVVRKAGRYLVFPRAALSELAGRSGPRDGLVEIWNGMPFFSPLWARGPRLVFLHHVHAEMWDMVLPPRLARLGDLIERRIAPPLYRRSQICTLSESSKREIVAKLHFRPDRVTVVPPGIDPSFNPGTGAGNPGTGAGNPGTGAGPNKAAEPLVVAVGRLMPVKHFDVLIRAVDEVRREVPDARLVIVGDGYDREVLEALVADLDAHEWVELPGRVTSGELVNLYRRAWVLTSASSHEGWGMTVTEAAACGTPAVVTRIAGHTDAVAEGISGLLADDPRELRDGLVAVLRDRALRERLAAGALAHAARFTWEATAIGTLEVLAREARRRRR